MGMRPGSGSANSGGMRRGRAGLRQGRAVFGLRLTRPGRAGGACPAAGCSPGVCLVEWHVLDDVSGEPEEAGAREGQERNLDHSRNPFRSRSARKCSPKPTANNIALPTTQNHNRRWVGAVPKASRPSGVTLPAERQVAATELSRPARIFTASLCIWVLRSIGFTTLQGDGGTG